MRDRDINRMSIHEQVRGTQILGAPSWSIYRREDSPKYPRDSYENSGNKDPNLKTQIEVKRGYPDPERYFAERQLKENEKYIEENKELFFQLEVEKNKKRLLKWYIGWFIPLCILLILILKVKGVL